MIKFTIIIAFFCCSGSCSRQKNGTIKGVVEDLGRYHIGQGAEVHIFEDDNGLINVRHIRSNGNESVSVEGFVEPYSDWFVYIEGDKNFYLYYGDGVDLYYESEAESGCKKIASKNDFVDGSMSLDVLPRTMIELVESRFPQSVDE